MDVADLDLCCNPFYAVGDTPTPPVTLQLTLNNTDCEVEVSDVEGSETILERTFTASDGCNESTCTVTYTWSGNKESPTNSGPTLNNLPV